MKNTIISELFSQNQALDYVEYDGNRIFRIDRITIPKKGVLRIVWEKTGGDWTQIVQRRFREP